MKTLSIDVRLAESDDARAISEAHRASWQHTYAGIIPHRALNKMLERRNENWWAKAMRGPATVLVADVAGTVAGYATFGANRARALPQGGEIYEIYMRPEYQGIGLGYALLKESCRMLSSLCYKGLVVWCLEDCDNATRFLRSNGGVDAVEGIEDFDDVCLKKLGFIWS